MNKRWCLYARFEDGRTRWANGSLGWTTNPGKAKAYTQDALIERMEQEQRRETVLLIPTSNGSVSINRQSGLVAVQADDVQWRLTS